MKGTIDELGRFFIPIDVRRKLNLKEKSSLLIEIKKNRIILTKDVDSWLICDSINNLVQINDLFICLKCIDKLKHLEAGTIIY